MDLLHLRYFQSIARFQHMTRASAHLNVSQPALSKILRQLEEELGVRLFDRVGKSLSLNEDGRILLKYTDIAFRALEDARTEMLDRREVGENRVNVSLKVALSCWTDLVVLFKKRHPEIGLFYKYHHVRFAKEIPSDLIFYASSYEAKGDNVVRLGEEPFSLLLPCAHPLAGRESVLLREVRDEPFICTSDDELRRTTEEMCRVAGFMPNVTMEADIYTNILDYVKHGFGVSIVPSFTWMYQPAPGLSLVTIRDVVRTRHMYLTWRENAYLSRAVRTLRDFIVAFFGESNLQKDEAGARVGGSGLEM